MAQDAIIDGSGNITVQGVEGIAITGSAANNDILQYNGTNWVYTLPSAIAVTNFSAGNLSPLFTTSVATSTTTPALSFTLSNAGAYTILGNNTNASATPTYFTPALSSALFQNQGTTTTVLHGNASGNPSWGTVNLTSDVSNILPLANGGTNANLIASNGGIFYSTSSAGAILSGTTTAHQILMSGASSAPAWSTSTYPSTNNTGDVVYGSASNALSTLAGNTTTTPEILTSTGTGAAATAPVWEPASSLGSGFILNQTSQQSSANFNISGAGTLGGLLTANLGLTVTGAAASLNASSNFATNINNGTSTGAVNIGNGTNTTITENGNYTLNGSNGTATTNIGTGTTTGAIQIGGTGAQNITVGQSTATNTVTIASASPSAATQTVNIGNGSAATSGGVAVNIGNGTPGASTTNTIAIGNGGSTTGTVGVTIGSNAAAAHTTTIEGGNSAGAIAINPNAAGSVSMGTTETGGAVTIGGTSETGTITVGQSTSTNTVTIASGSPSSAIQTINIGNGSAATSGGVSVGIGNGTPGAGTTNTIAIGNGGSTTGTDMITIGSNTAAAHTTTIEGGNSAGAIAINPNAAGSVSIGTTETGGAVTIGGTSETGTITVGQSTATNTVTIANGTSTGTQTINIGNGGGTSGTDVIIIGSNAAAAHTTNIEGGNSAGAIAINPNAAGSVSIGTTETGGAVTIGGTSETGAITLGQSTGTNTVTIASGSPSSATQTVNIGNGAAATSGGVTVNIADGAPGTGTINTVNIGNGVGAGAGKANINIGSINGSGTTTIESGSGGIILQVASATVSAPVKATAGYTTMLNLTIPANTVITPGETFECKLYGIALAAKTVAFQVYVGTTTTAVGTAVPGAGITPVWTSATSAAQVVNELAGLDVLVTLYSATTVQASGMAWAEAASLGNLAQTAGEIAPTTIAPTSTWYIIIAATCSTTLDWEGVTGSIQLIH